MQKYAIKVHLDYDVNSPCEEDGNWQVYSFNRSHTNYKHPDEIFKDSDGEKNQEIEEKLKVGLAFVLSYYEHGLSMWSVAGSGPQCEWDTTRFAGIAVWEEDPDNMGAKTYEDRKKDCQRGMETYTEWCNGHCYWYQITNRRGKVIEQNSYLIGNDQLEDSIRESLPDDATKANTAIDDKYGVLSYSDIFKKKKAG